MMLICARSRLAATVALVGCVAFACSGKSALAGNLFVIVATDDAAPKIGEDMLRNSKLMLSTIKTSVPKSRAQIVKVPPNSFTSATVLRTISLMPTRPDDAVFFYYSGHGAYDSTKRQTYLMMSGDRGNAALYVGQVRRSIEAKGVRFVAIVVDCCNDLRPVRGMGPMAPGDPPEDRPQQISPVFQHLFFEPAGSVIIESSAPGEYAVIEPPTQFRDPQRGVYEVHLGSLFTQVFSDVYAVPSFEGDVEKPPEWSEICRRTQELIDLKFPQLCPRGLIPLGNQKPVAQKSQTVTAWINDRSIPTR